MDNNVISNFFSGLFTEKAMDFVADVIDQIPNISVVTEIEALSWINPDKSKEAIVKEFIQDANVFGLTPDVISECVKIRRSKKIKTPDAIIAATAIVHSLTLLQTIAILIIFKASMFLIQIACSQIKPPIECFR